jgi:hypothetical protein
MLLNQVQSHSKQLSKYCEKLGDTNPVRVDVELPPPALALGEMPNLVRTSENSEVNLANTANGGSLTLILEDAIQASAEAMLPPPAPGELSNTVSTMGGKLGWKEGSAVIVEYR